jgi:L-cysteine:1D-myo-inositol 2-amino-2-deoxy-alpha-D-glucopyranoside ligase
MSASHARVAYADPGAFARRYAHAGMVRLDGEKMSKSLGNLEFVSELLASGADPMAIRLALLAHRYRHDWDWTPQGLAGAQERLDRWRSAVNRASSPQEAGGGEAAAAEIPGAGSVLAGVRERLADDLDAPGALDVVDSWVRAIAAAPALPEGASAAAALVRDTVDALLGVAL